MSPFDTALVRAYLANVQAALRNLDVLRAETFIESVQKLLVQPSVPSSDQPMQLNVGIGLDTGIKRQGKPNEDVAFAATGSNMQTQEMYGLLLVADGMGGHANGHVASRLATETVVNMVLPGLHGECMQTSNVSKLLMEAMTRANALIYEQNREGMASRFLEQMGTTMTVAAVLGARVCIAHAGDSRAYLYRPGTGLRVITHDHSVVANLVASGALQADEIYTHPKRNIILRCLGVAPSIEVDLFSEQLQDGDILLLCTDGVWEMARDLQIERILSSPWLSAEHLAERLTHAALRGGGLDNIGLVVAQIQINLTAMQTMVHAQFPPAGALL